MAELGAIGARLEELGWVLDRDSVRDTLQPILRGVNVVAVVPPSPAWGDLVVGTLIARRDTAPGDVLILTAPALLGEWTATVGALVEGTPVQVDTIRDAGSLTGPGLPSDVVIATPASAFARHQLSALHPERFATVVLAWPEDWNDDDAIAGLLADLPREAQRILLTSQSDHKRTEDLAERYARRAALVDPFRTEDGGAAAVLHTVSSTPTSWAGRAQAAAELVASFAGRLVTIWTADTRDHRLLRRTLGSLRTGVSIVTGSSEPHGEVVICYDLPTASQLRQFPVPEIVLLVPPGTAAYLARVAPVRTPLDLSTLAAAIRTRDAARRDEIVRALREQDHAAALYIIAPLFERHDPQHVAGALYHLWQEAERTRAVPAAPPPPVPVPGSAATTRLWVSAGKKDGATVADLVAVLVREVGMDRAEVGRIDLRDTFALVEVPEAKAGAIATRLTGLTIRKRKVSARVDSRRAAQRGGP